MTHQAPAAVFGLQMFMRRQHGGNLRFNGLCQELASAAAEYFGQRIGRHPWMVQRDNTIFRHGVSLLAWRPGGFVTPHDTPPPSLSPSPTLGHSSTTTAQPRFPRGNRSVSPWHRPTDPRVRCAQMTALGALRPFITSARPRPSRLGGTDTPRVNVPSGRGIGDVGIIIPIGLRSHKGAGNAFCHALSSSAWRFLTRILAPT